MNRRAPRDRGFSLIEVLVAVAIASGLLVAVLVFYRHAASVRDQMDREVEVVSAARLVMERLTRELQAVTIDHGHRRGITGHRDRIELLTTVLPDESAWAREPGVSTPAPQTDLRWVEYRRGGHRGGHRGGIERRELRLLAGEDHGRRRLREPVSSRLQFLRLRYHDGREWQDEWRHGHLPRGVEVNLGAEPFAHDGDLDEYPADLFRRVIHIPAATRVGPTQWRSG